MRHRAHSPVHPLDPQLAELSHLLADIGEPCWAGYDTAAALFGFAGFRLTPPFHVVVPRGRFVHRVGHVVHTLRDIEPIDRESILGVPTTSPTRTLLQLAAIHDVPRVTAALESALREGLTTEDALHRRVAALRVSGRNGVRRAFEMLELAEITRGGESWLEAEFLRLVAAAGLPRPRTQTVLSRRRDRLVRVDFRFDGTPVVVETLGYRWHRTAAQMTVDAERINRLVLDGFVPIQFTYHQVVDDPGFVIATLVEALGRHGIQPRRPRR